DKLVTGVQTCALPISKITISVRATPKGGLFKSIGTGEIARAIKDQKDIDIPEEAVLSEPIKTTGEHAAQLQSKNARATITIIIRSEERRVGKESRTRR